MTREAHAHLLRQAASTAVDELHRLLDARFTMTPRTYRAAETAALALVRDRLDALAVFAGLGDAEAELEFDAAPDEQWQVTTPAGVER